MNPLRTTTEIFRALSDDYRYLRDAYDPHKRERRSTGVLKRDLEPYACVLCGETPPAVADLQAAHINPLSESAKTILDNLVWLCVRDDHSEPGCHALFDRGLGSVVQMRRAKRARARTTPARLRETMLALNAAHPTATQQRGAPVRQLALAVREQSAHNVTSTDWHAAQVAIAALHRRRATKDALRRALVEIDRVNPTRLSAVAGKSRFYYERGYINLLGGNLPRAFRDFAEGPELFVDLNDPGQQWRWAAHTSIMAQIDAISRASHQNKWSWAATDRELTKALRLASKALRSKADRRHANGWYLNCLVHLVAPALGAGDYRRARRYLGRAMEQWEDSTVASGWDVAARVTLLMYRGRLELEDGKNPAKARRALSFLVRALPLYRQRRQQPEGMRDVLFGIARALESVGEPARAHRVESVASRCMDMSSWLDPYVPASVLLGPALRAIRGPRKPRVQRFAGSAG